MSDDTPEMVAIQGLSNKVDTLHEMAQDAFKRGSKRMDEHDDRLRAVERRQSWFMGIGVAIMGMLSFIGKLPQKIIDFFTT